MKVIFFIEHPECETLHTQFILTTDLWGDWSHSHFADGKTEPSGGQVTDGVLRRRWQSRFVLLPAMILTNMIHCLPTPLLLQLPHFKYRTLRNREEGWVLSLRANSRHSLGVCQGGRTSASPQLHRTRVCILSRSSGRAQSKWKCKAPN